MSILAKLSRTVNKWIEYLVSGLGLSMSIIVAVQVFCRYVLNHSLFWSEELARFLLVWLTFLGASIAYYRGVHPGIDVIYTRMPNAIRKVAAITVHLLSMILFVIMIIFGIKFSYFIRHQISPALYLPKWLVFTIIPLSGSILMLHSLIFFLDEIKGKSRDS
jgi:TRAP-type C4-dicarboxylate transport system permease small subunit